jgi:hypothetical protein
MVGFPLNLTLSDKSKKCSLSTLGKILRQLRNNKQLLLREVAAELKMDTALLSKF